MKLSTRQGPENLVELPFSRILVGIDLSSPSSKILRRASYLARKFDSQITICNVANVITGVAGNEVDGYPATSDEQKVLLEMEELVHKEFGDSGAKKIELKILHGDPADRIVEYAEFCNADLIILGSRSRGALKRALLGSVSSAVVTNAVNSVLIIK